MSGGNQTLIDRTEENFFLIAIIAVVVALAGAYLQFGPYIAIRGSYVLFGLLTAGALIRYATDRRTGQEHRRTYRSGWMVTVSIFNLAVASTILLDSRLPSLLFLLPVGYAFLVGRLVYGFVEPRKVLLEACSLFAIGPVTKYVSSGVYIGNTDLLLHLRDIRRFVRAGEPSVILANSYDQFPGLHVFVGEFKMLGGLSSYDALITTGIVVYVLSICLLYVLARFLFSNRRLALFVALGATLIHSLSYYSTYFFPQAFASVLLLFFVFIVYRADGLEGKYQYRMLSLGFAIFVATVFTHHFTFVLFFPIFAVLVAVPLIADRVLDAEIKRFRLAPVGLGYALTVGYWTLFADRFLLSLRNGIAFVLTQGPLAGSSGASSETSIEGLGTQIPEPTVVTAIYDLAGPINVYYTLLTVFFSIGIYALLQNFGWYERALGAVACGVVSSLFVFQTPLVVSGAIRRIRLPMSFVFVFVTGIGIHYIVTSITKPQTKIAVVVLLMLSGTAAPLVAADDLANLDSPPQTQAAFSDSEFSELRYSSQFVRTYNTNVSSMWLTRRALIGFNTSVNDQVTVEEGSIRTSEDLFIYRKAWDRHRTVYRPDPPGAMNVLVIESSWLDRTTEAENKVYASDTVGMIWDPTRTIGPNATAETTDTLRQGRLRRAPVFESRSERRTSRSWN